MIRSTLIAGLVLGAMTGCAPEVGSERWCDMMESTPKGEWTANDAASYTKSCLLDLGKDD